MSVIKTLVLFVTCCFYGVPAQSCNLPTCQYYQVLAYQLSPLFQNAGSSLFNDCSCQFYGLTLPNPLTPDIECGRSDLTGSATTYLQRRPKIVGGLPAQECQYPWQVHVKAGGYNCGGTLIDYQHVITAAHCLQTGNYKIPASSVTIGVGSSTKSKLTYYPVSVVSRHPSYYPATFGFDIAVLTLQTKLPETNSCIKPACMPSLTLNVAVGTPCLVTGWGALKESGSFPDILQEAVVPILDNSVCLNAYGSSMIDDKKLCAGYSTGGIDACQGDSGGPLMCADGDSWALAGVVSFGLGCARPSYPGVYTHVSNLKDWVENIIT